MPASGPRVKDKDKKVVDAFIDGEPLDGDLLSTDGVQLVSHVPLGGGVLAERNPAGEISINDLGGRWDQSVANYIRKNTPKNFLLENKMENLREARQARLDKQGAADNRVYDMLDQLKAALTPEVILDELVSAMTDDHALEYLDWVITMHDLDEDPEMDEF
jgi:hypothetical protein